MSRINIAGDYAGENYILRLAEDALEGKRGEVYKTITPHQVFSVCGSIGAYYAKPVKYAGQQMLSLVRISGSEKYWKPEEILNQINREHRRGEVLKPGMTGLWAVTPGSARRGLMHRLPEPTDDPIVAALRKAGMPSKSHDVFPEGEIKIEMEVAEGGNLCSHQVGGRGHYNCYFRTDGVWEVVERAPTEQHGSYGCQTRPNRVRITGATWVVEATTRLTCSGCGDRSIDRVTVTPDADRGIVAQAICAMMHIKP